MCYKVIFFLFFCNQLLVFNEPWQGAHWSIFLNRLFLFWSPHSIRQNISDTVHEMLQLCQILISALLYLLLLGLTPSPLEKSIAYVASLSLILQYWLTVLFLLLFCCIHKWQCWCILNSYLQRNAFLRHTTHTSCQIKCLWHWPMQLMLLWVLTGRQVVVWWKPACCWLIRYLSINEPKRPRQGSIKGFLRILTWFTPEMCKLISRPTGQPPAINSLVDFAVQALLTQAAELNFVVTLSLPCGLPCLWALVEENVCFDLSAHRSYRTFR